jgi:hypothetical protein
MNLEDILAISGRPGLFKMQAQTRGGIVATSLIDGKRITSSVNNQISVLSEIQVYCIGKEIPLTEVLERMLKHESGQVASVSPKASSTDLEAYFFDVVEEYDEDRVYSSDIKKIIQWYNLLTQKKIIEFQDSKKEEKQEHPIVDSDFEATSEE